MPGWHFAAARQRFRDRAFPFSPLPEINRLVFGEAMPFYPGDAPSSSAMCRKVARNGNDCGRRTTMRRTEAITRAPNFRTPDLAQ